MVVLDEERSYMQNKETNRKAQIGCERGYYVMCVWSPVSDGEGVEGQSLLDLGHGESGSAGFHPAGVRTVSPCEDNQH